MQQRVTVVVVTWNGAHLLGPCLESLAAQTIPHRVLVVDNASTDDTTGLLAGFPAVDVVRMDTNTGFAGGAQAGLDRVNTEFAAFLNNDATAEPGWLAALLAPLDDDATVAATTSRILLAADGRINNAGGAMTRWGAGYDRGYGEPDGPPYGARSTSASSVAARVRSGWRPQGPSADSRSSSSCTTRTPTCPGGWA